MLLAALGCGITLLATEYRPPSVVSAMPTIVQAGWEVGLIVAGVVGLIGVTWKGQLSTALGVELLGVAVLGSVTSMYAIALAVIAGVSATAAGAFVGGVAVGAWWRVGQIGRDLMRVARAAESGVMADVPLLVERDR